MKYGELTLGQVEAIVNKLGGMEGVSRFLRGELEVKAVERFFPIWKTLRLGTGLKTAADFRGALQDSGHRIGEWASDILGKCSFKASLIEMEVDLVVTTVAELGFKNGATRENIYKRALEFGLKLCPPEVGPQLRLQYTDQPWGEWLLIGMEPIAASGGYLRVFSVVRDDGGLWLDSYFGYPGSVWYGSDRWVFVRGK
ncbi:hypothetical protein HYT45_03025 [Candidatus Uhrbacteria bacterium]|nr:hypothetical protein [Candidatus Uhrbacteria bacterium]